MTLNVDLNVIRLYIMLLFRQQGELFIFKVQKMITIIGILYIIGKLTKLHGDGDLLITLQFLLN